MPRTRPFHLATAALLAAGLLTAATTAPSPPDDPAPTAVPGVIGGCYFVGLPITAQEQRTTQALPGQSQPAARQLVDAGGFGPLVDDFRRALCEVTDLDQASALVTATGTELWEAAVARAQGEQVAGTIDRYDDRPLYWARTTMTRALREWLSSFELSPTQQGALVRQLSYASRGVDSVRYPEDTATRVLVSGFDTFGLDASLRTSNPSGAAALQLDGRTVQTPQGPVVVQAVMLPVSWTAFDQGIVEDAFGPWLVPSDDPRHAGRADLVMTISQTGRGRMDLEEWAAGFRGGAPDDDGVIAYGPVSAAALWPQPQPSPQFIETTLPVQAMVDAGTGPWPVALNSGVTEWPAGTYPDPGALRAADDPSPGSRAASGPGGDYLSNESAYRVNRLRLGAGQDDLPGGHLHISSLLHPDDPAALTSPAFEADRSAVVDQAVALVEAAGAAVSPRG